MYIASHSFFEHGSLRGVSKVLGQITDLEITWTVDCAFIWLDGAHQHADESGFAGTVAANERDPPPRLEFERDVFEQPPRTKRDSEIRRRKHGDEAIAALRSGGLRRVRKTHATRIGNFRTQSRGEMDHRIRTMDSRAGNEGTAE